MACARSYFVTLLQIIRDRITLVQDEVGKSHRCCCKYQLNLLLNDECQRKENFGFVYQNNVRSETDGLITFY
jgi:hypothetical protein